MCVCVGGGGGAGCLLITLPRNNFAPFDGIIEKANHLHDDQICFFPLVLHSSNKHDLKQDVRVVFPEQESDPVTVLV